MDTTRKLQTVLFIQVYPEYVPLHKYNNSDDVKFIKFINELDLLELINARSNEHESVLVLTNFLELYSIVCKCNCNFDSDITLLNLMIATQNLHKHSPTRCIFSLKRTDYFAIIRKLTDFNLYSIIRGCTSAR